MNSLICGFLVLRRPEQNYDETCQPPYYLQAFPPCINNIYYSGIARVPWYELEENYYAGTLPKEMSQLRDYLYDKAQHILDYSK